MRVRYLMTENMGYLRLSATSRNQVTITFSMIIRQGSVKKDSMGNGPSPIIIAIHFHLLMKTGALSYSFFTKPVYHFIPIHCCDICGLDTQICLLLLLIYLFLIYPLFYGSLHSLFPKAQFICSFDITLYVIYFFFLSSTLRLPFYSVTLLLRTASLRGFYSKKTIPSKFSPCILFSFSSFLPSVIASFNLPQVDVFVNQNLSTTVIDASV